LPRTRGELRLGEPTQNEKLYLPLHSSKRGESGSILHRPNR